MPSSFTSSSTATIVARSLRDDDQRIAQEVDDLRRSNGLLKKSACAKSRGLDAVAELLALGDDDDRQIGMAVMQFLEKRNAGSFEREVEKDRIDRAHQHVARVVGRVHAEHVDAERPRLGAESVAELGVISDDEESRVRRRRHRETRNVDRVALSASVESRAGELASKLGDDLGEAGRRRPAECPRFPRESARLRGRAPRRPKSRTCRRRRELSRVLRGPAAGVVGQRFRREDGGRCLERRDVSQNVSVCPLPNRLYAVPNWVVLHERTIDGRLHPRKARRSCGCTAETGQCDDGSERHAH